MGAGGPHLLPVDHELVAVEFGAGAQGCEVGSRTRLTHPQRRRHLGAQDGDGPALLLLGVPNEISDAEMMPTPCGLKVR